MPSQFDAWYRNCTVPQLRCKSRTDGRHVTSCPEVHSLLTPFGRRFQKRLHHRSCLPQEDGAHLPVEVPGRPRGKRRSRAGAKPLCSCSVWTTTTQTRASPRLCSKPTSSTSRPSSGSSQKRGNLARQQRTRAEQFPRLARQPSAKTGRSPPPQWSEVLVAASEDERYWSRESRHPAVGFLARCHSKVSGGPAADEEDQYQNHQAREEAAKSTATCLDRLSGSPNERRERLPHHHGRWPVSFRWSKIANEEGCRTPVRKVEPTCA